MNNLNFGFEDLELSKKTRLFKIEIKKLSGLSMDIVDLRKKRDEENLKTYLTKPFIYFLYPIYLYTLFTSYTLTLQNDLLF